MSYKETAVTGDLFPVHALRLFTRRTKPLVKLLVCDAGVYAAQWRQTPCWTAICTGEHLDLAHPLARDAEFVREHSKRDRVFGQAPRFEDPALANVKSRQRLDQRLAPIFQLFVLDPDALLARRVIDQPILPFAGIAVLSDRRISEASPPSPIHVYYVVLGDAEAFGEELDLIRAHIAFVEHGNAAFGLAQIEE